MYKEIFAEIAGGKVLDVATGEGGFVEILQQNLQSYAGITGIDTSDEKLRTAAKREHSEKVQFVRMNAEQLGFERETFDTVSIAISLHHLENVPRVLTEMKRSLKSGGKFIVAEMHRDGSSAAQFNAIRIHHWAASVDTARGILHDRTFSRAEIMDYVGELGLYKMRTWDIQNIDTDPLVEQSVGVVEQYLLNYLQRADGFPMLIQHGDELRGALHEKGVQMEPLLVVIGEKA